MTASQLEFAGPKAIIAIVYLTLDHGQSRSRLRLEPPFRDYVFGWTARRTETFPLGAKVREF